jgi:hypothetical protein
MPTRSRLPDVYFVAQPPAVPEALPRMDITGFVGFAASGPVDIPVSIEDPARFQEIFGRDLPIAWDRDRGERLLAQLAPTVRQFFSCGGLRCWVVRAAGSDATVNRFLIPGVLSVAPPDEPQAAVTLARSVGSWSDTLAVNAALTLRPVEVAPRSPRDGSIAVSRTQPGDLLQVTFPGTPTVLYLPVAATSDQAQAGSGPASFSLATQAGVWFRPLQPDDFTAAQTSPPAGAGDTTIWLEPPLVTHWLTGWADPNEPQRRLIPVQRLGILGNQFLIQCDQADAVSIQAGSWLRLAFRDAPDPLSRPILVAQVDALRSARPDSQSPPANPLGEPVWIVVRNAWWLLDPARAAQEFAGAAAEAAVVEFELWVRDTQGGVTRLDGLGGHPDHPRYWGGAPSDDDLFRSQDIAATVPTPELRAAVSHPRFPLSAPRAAAPWYLPLGVPSVVRDDFYQPPLPQGNRPLERDGLATYSWRLLLDGDLWDASAATLLTQAFHKQYQLRRAGDSGPPGKPLTKLHALLPIEEISLLAVPDAVHRGWAFAAEEQLAQLAPTLINVVPAANGGGVTVTWTRVPGASSYTLEQSPDPQFRRTVASWSVPGERFEIALGSRDCPETRFYRVRAETQAAGVSPWSNTLWQRFPASQFEVCGYEPLVAPTALAVREESGRLVLTWTSAVAGAGFQLERASDPAFASARLAYEGQSHIYAVWSVGDGISYFRVSARLDGQESPWSAAVTTGVLRHEGYEVVPVTLGSPDGMLGHPIDTLANVHTAMLRMGAARGDILALLSLPGDFRVEQAVRYRARLDQTVGGEDGRVLSFGAMYHPWLVVRATAGVAGLTTWRIPPDGAACGVLAGRTLAGGAWLSPGNQLLREVVALEPTLEEASLRGLYDVQINPIEQRPTGFLTRAADTLSPVSELRAINVRRLLILLRRLALREGMRFVFEANNDRFRRLVQREFEELLGRLYARGAFTGASRAEAFRVITDDSVNPPENVDLGRFIVELRVAPSLPMTFLTVRLVQTGSGLLAAEVA